MALPKGRIELPRLKFPNLRAEPVRFGLGLAGLAFLATLVLPHVKLFGDLELRTQDVRMQLRGERPVDDAIALVNIDEQSLRQYGNSWPLPRDQYAILLEALRAMDAKAVGIDLLYVGPDKVDPNYDLLLAAAIDRDPRIANGVYFPLKRPDGPELVPAESLSRDPQRERWLRFTEDLPRGVDLMRSVDANFDMEENIADASADVGHVALSSDQDGVVRSLPLLINHQGRAFPSLSLLLTARYLGANWRDLHFDNQTAILPYPGGEKRIPVDRFGQVLISFPGEEKAFKNRHSFTRVLNDLDSRVELDESGKPKPLLGANPFRGKVVLVCNTAATSAISDFGPTPFSANFPLAYAHVSVVNSILKNDFIRTADRRTEAWIWLALAAVLGLVLSLCAPAGLAVTTAAVLVGYVVAGWALATFSGLSIQLVPPVFMVFAISSGIVLRGYILRERQRRMAEQELAVARRIQQDLLPKGVLAVRDVEVAGMNLPCFAVGGDYFDFFNLSDGRIALAIGDVAGKGVPAAILMSNLQAILRAECSRGTDVPHVPAQANRQLMESIQGNSKFVTFFYGALDPAARRLSYSNAGHNPPLVVRANGAIEELEVGGLILGVFPMAEYDEGTVDLMPGDVVVLFTDGVTEAESRHGLYGDERLHGLLRKLRGQSAHEIGEAICRDVAAFSHGLHQSDDVTVVVVKVREAGASDAPSPAAMAAGAA